MSRGIGVNGVKIRRARLSDAAELTEIYSYYVNNTAITFEDEAPDVRAFEGRMRGIISFYPYFVAEGGEGIVGFCYAGAFKNRSAYDWAVETTVYVKRGAARSGIGTALYSALEGALAAQGIKNMYACIACPVKEADEYLDFGSVQFHKKCGFTVCGTFELCGNKFGRWYNMVWMQKFIGSHEDFPARPLPCI